MSNVSTEQVEYLLALMGALVESQTQQAELIAKAAASLESVASTLDDIRYDMRYPRES